MQTLEAKRRKLRDFNSIKEPTRGLRKRKRKHEQSSTTNNRVMGGRGREGRRSELRRVLAIKKCSQRACPGRRYKSNFEVGGQHMGIGVEEKSR